MAGRLSATGESSGKAFVGCTCSLIHHLRVHPMAEVRGRATQLPLHFFFSSSRSRADEGVVDTASGRGLILSMSWNILAASTTALPVRCRVPIKWRGATTRKKATHPFPCRLVPSSGPKPGKQKTTTQTSSSRELVRDCPAPAPGCFISHWRAAGVVRCRPSIRRPTIPFYDRHKTNEIHFGASDIGDERPPFCPVDPPIS